MTILKENQEILNIGLNANANENLQFLKELYYIMYKFNIYRIYRLTYKDTGELIDAHQALKTNIGNTNFTYMIFECMKEKLPRIYYKIFYRAYIIKYRKKLKELCDTYHIKAIHSKTYSLYQGIYISNGKLCINSVDIIYSDNSVNSIHKLYLDI